MLDGARKPGLIKLGVVAAIPWSMLMIHHTLNPQREMFPNPPPKTPIIEVLEREISLMPGSVFRGRVATFTGQTLEGNAKWGALGYRDYLMRNRFGTEHRSIGLWYYGIPTLWEYSPFITPAFYQFTKTLFAIPGDQQTRNVMTLRHPNAAMLAAIGVRFVITDEPITKGKLQATFPLADMGMLYLNEIESPNVGQYSPQQVIVSHNASETMQLLSRKDFDPQKTVVTETALPSNLLPATSGKISVHPGGSLRITGTSPGTSMLLLPLEFSHCLMVMSDKQTANPPTIFRANLVQTGILFDRTVDVSIKFFLGPFQNSRCRLADVEDFKALSPK